MGRLAECLGRAGESGFWAFTFLGSKELSQAQGPHGRPSGSEHPGIDLPTGKPKSCMSGYHFKLLGELKMAKLSGPVHIDSVPPGAWSFYLSIILM